MIYCVWYPCGGFGHFVNAVLTVYGTDFVKPKAELEFGINGNSHQLDLVATKYLHDPDQYTFNFDQDKIYSVLIDNGINNESKKFQQIFANSLVIKICYTDNTWPIVCRTMIEKAMNVDFDSEVMIGNDWGVQDQWATREKYFLMLRDHNLRHCWKPEQDCLNLLVDDLLDYQQFFNKLQSFEIKLSNFETAWGSWRQTNSKFIDPVIVGAKIMHAIKTNQPMDLSTVSDTWTQAVVYYNIWCQYQFEVLHNEYSNWFTNTKDIVTMLDKHGVIH